MDKICLLALTMPDWQEMFALANYFNEQKVFRPVMLLAASKLSDVFQKTNDSGIEVIELNEADYLEDQSDHLPNWLGAVLKLSEKISYQLPSKRLALEWESRSRFRNLQRQYAFLRDAIDKIEPSCVLLRNGRNFNWEQALIRVCKENDIPTLIPPIAYSGDYRDLLRPRSAPEFIADRFPRLRKKYPDQWVWDSKRQANIFFFGAADTLALVKSKMLPPNPWLPGGGHQTVLMCESIEAKERYLKLGVDHKDLVLTGHPAHDEIFKGLQQKKDSKLKLASKYGLKPHEPLVLVSIPPLFEQGSHDQLSAISEIESLCEQLASLSCNCLISLHPKMPVHVYEFIAQKYGLPIADERLQSIIATADLFLASFSSTVFYAAMCGIPTLIFAFHGYRFSMFDHLQGVHVLDHLEDLVPELARLFSDKAYYDSLAEQQRKSRDRLSLFDGNCKKRIADLILRCASQKSATPAISP